MPINVMPVPGLIDHLDDVRSHAGRGVDGQMVTDRLPRPPGRAHDDAHHILVAENVLRHDDEKESGGSGG